MDTPLPALAARLPAAPLGCEASKIDPSHCFSMILSRKRPFCEAVKAFFYLKITYRETSPCFKNPRFHRGFCLLCVPLACGAVATVSFALFLHLLPTWDVALSGREEKLGTLFQQTARFALCCPHFLETNCIVLRHTFRYRRKRGAKLCKMRRNCGAEDNLKRRVVCLEFTHS